MTREADSRHSRSFEEAELLDLASRYLPSGVRNATVNPANAMVIREAHGSRITDISGNEYIDYLLGSGPMFLGHAHPAVVEAVTQQLSRGSSYLMVSEPPIRLAEQIVELVPCAEMVTFHSSGSEATFYALRLARAFRDRSKILKFEGGYHGMHDCALMSTQWTRESEPYPRAVPNSAGIPPSLVEDVLVAPYNDLDSAVRIIEAHADELAAVIVEPMQRTFPPRPGFLDGLRELTREREILLVFDEVVTGFRFGLGGAQAYYGVTPDLCALGKSISAGHPIGVLCGREEIMRLANPLQAPPGKHVMLSGTYSSNPISAVAALASIDVLRQPGVYEQVFERGQRLKDSLQAKLRDADLPATVTGESVAFQPWFTREDVFDHRTAATSKARLNFRFIDLLLERGVVKAHEKFFISTAHEEADIEDTLDAFDSAIQVLAAEYREHRDATS